jgi:hypothetical protein
MPMKPSIILFFLFSFSLYAMENEKLIETDKNMYNFFEGEAKKDLGPITNEVLKLATPKESFNGYQKCIRYMKSYAQKGIELHTKNPSKSLSEILEEIRRTFPTEKELNYIKGIAQRYSPRLKKLTDFLCKSNPVCAKECKREFNDIENALHEELIELHESEKVVIK